MFSEFVDAFPDAQVADGFYGGRDRLEDMAEFVMRRLSGPLNLIGHSMGARVALEIIRRAPERVARLALVDTGVHPVAAGEEDKRLAIQQLGRDQGFETLVDAWLPPMLSPAARRDKVLVSRLRTMCLSAGLTTFEAQTRALLARRSVEHLLGSITCPVHCIVGQLDEWSPPSQHRKIASLIPGAMLQIVEGAGHMLPCEQPNAFNKSIAAWLAEPITSASANQS